MDTKYEHEIGVVCGGDVGMNLETKRRREGEGVFAGKYFDAEQQFFLHRNVQPQYHVSTSHCQTARLVVGKKMERNAAHCELSSRNQLGHLCHWSTARAFTILDINEAVVNCLQTSDQNLLPPSFAHLPSFVSGTLSSICLQSPCESLLLVLRYVMFTSVDLHMARC